MVPSGNSHLCTYMHSDFLSIIFSVMPAPYSPHAPLNPGPLAGKRVRAPAISVPSLPVVLRGPTAAVTADLNRENYVAWALQVASMAGDRRLEAQDRMFAQKMALLLTQKLVPNASAIDQIDRQEDRRVFRELARLSTDDLLRMARVTPAGLAQAARERVQVVEVSADPGPRAVAEAKEKRDALPPQDGALCYSLPLSWSGERAAGDALKPRRQPGSDGEGESEI